MIPTLYNITPAVNLRAIQTDRFKNAQLSVSLILPADKELSPLTTLLFSVLSCQFISNVPSAILLSQFTDNYRQLLLGVNIGGVGTLIASLASLITFREYTKQNKGKSGYYILLFSAFNFAFMIILACFVMVLK